MKSYIIYEKLKLKSYIPFRDESRVIKYHKCMNYKVGVKYTTILVPHKGFKNVNIFSLILLFQTQKIHLN